ncbi:VOC family protein [Chloroflexota bacterium]
MTNSSKPTISITDLDQVCIVVRDLDKSMKSMWNTFGIGPWDIYIRDCNSTRDGESISNMTYHGKPARFSYKVAVTHNKLGGIQIELVQPVEGDNIYSDFLREHGEGTHHLGWYVVDSQEAFAETTRMLEKGGFPCIQSMRVYAAALAYFDTTKVLNTILEVAWWDPSRSMPAPARVFPE